MKKLKFIIIILVILSFLFDIITTILGKYNLHETNLIYIITGSILLIFLFKTIVNFIAILPLIKNWKFSSERIVFFLSFILVYLIVLQTSVGIHNIDIIRNPPLVELPSGKIVEVSLPENVRFEGYMETAKFTYYAPLLLYILTYFLFEQFVTKVSINKRRFSIGK